MAHNLPAVLTQVPAVCRALPRASSSLECLIPVPGCLSPAHLATATCCVCEARGDTFVLCPTRLRQGLSALLRHGHLLGRGAASAEVTAHSHTPWEPVRCSGVKVSLPPASDSSVSAQQRRPPVALWSRPLSPQADWGPERAHRHSPASQSPRRARSPARPPSPAGTHSRPVRCLCAGSCHAVELGSTLAP